MRKHRHGEAETRIEIARQTNRDRQRHRRTDEQTDSINKDMQIVVHTGRRTDYNTARGGNRQSSFTFR